jgi:serine protease Do
LGLWLQDSPDGVIISTIAPRGPAAEAGLQRGDRVLLVGQDAVATAEEARRAIEAAMSGGRSAVVLQIDRGGQKRFIGVPFSVS